MILGSGSIHDRSRFPLRPARLPAATGGRLDCGSSDSLFRRLFDWSLFSRSFLGRSLFGRSLFGRRPFLAGAFLAGAFFAAFLAGAFLAAFFTGFAAFFADFAAFFFVAIPCIPRVK